MPVNNNNNETLPGAFLKILIYWDWDGNLEFCVFIRDLSNLSQAGKHCSQIEIQKKETQNHLCQNRGID